MKCNKHIGGEIPVFIWHITWIYLLAGELVGEFHGKSTLGGYLIQNQIVFSCNCKVSSKQFNFVTLSNYSNNHILRKCTGGYKITKSMKKITHLLYVNDIKIFA